MLEKKECVYVSEGERQRKTKGIFSQSFSKWYHVDAYVLDQPACKWWT